MTTQFQNKVALVTGAAAGIGLATARAFAKAGAKVVLADKSEDMAAQAADALKSEGHDVMALGVDVADPAAVAGMVERAVAAFGRLDVAFNNAGVITRHIETAELSLEEWNRVMATNLTGTFLCMQAEIRQMLKQGGGTIVNCSSIGGLRGVAGLPAYIASKHGVVGLTKAAALEYCRKDIRINAVCPGQIATPMNDWLTNGDKQMEAEMIEKTQPIGRLGSAEEIADAVLWLASPNASFMVGATVSVDGGQAAH
jgi:NAD(P)-dependent dehydrogenase (short-subunit alcohol dehydrogenase family)